MRTPEGRAGGEAPSPRGGRTTIQGDVDVRTRVRSGRRGFDDGGGTTFRRRSFGDDGWRGPRWRRRRRFYVEPDPVRIIIRRRRRCWINRRGLRVCRVVVRRRW